MDSKLKYMLYHIYIRRCVNCGKWLIGYPVIQRTIGNVCCKCDIRLNGIPNWYITQEYECQFEDKNERTNRSRT